MKLIRIIAWGVTCFGAINAGLWGFFQLDLVCLLAHSQTSFFARSLYALIGIGGVYTIHCRLMSRLGMLLNKKNLKGYE